MASDAPESPPPALVFVSDESEEGPLLARALSERGFDAHAVPTGVLNERASTRPPRVVVCDLDATGALAAVEKLRELPDGEHIDVIFLSAEEPEEADALTEQSSGLFLRPVDPSALVHKIEALLGMPPAEPQPELPSTTPPRTAGSATPNAQPPEADFPSHSSVPVDDEHSYPSLPAPVPLGFAPEPEAPRHIPQTEMSPELESLLARAEQRIGSMAPGRSDKPPPSLRMSPDEEVEAVLPVEVLAALDEPLDLEAQDDDSDIGSAYGTRSGSASGRTGLGTGTGTHSAGGTGLGTAAGTVAGPLSQAFVPHMSTAGAEPTAPPPRGTSGGRTNVASQPPATPRTGAQASTRPPEGSGRAQPPSWPAPPPNAMVTAVEARGLSGTPSSRSLPEIIEPRPPRPYDVPLGAPPPVRIDPVPTAAPAAPRTPDIPSVLGRGDALEALARAVRSRFSGALALEDGAGIRRVVMRDGDIVIAASGAEGGRAMGIVIKGVRERAGASADGGRIAALVKSKLT